MLLRKFLPVSAVLVLAWLVFVLTRRLGWSLGWVYLWLCGVAWVINLFCLLSWNRVLITVYVVAVIESDWISMTPGAAWLLALVIFLAGWSLLIWSQVVNPFLEKTVPIQTDHGHRVIQTGPYAHVRHPFYVDIVLCVLATPLLLMSIWAFIPAVLALGGLVIRTVLEDRTLYQELPG